MPRRRFHLVRRLILIDQNQGLSTAFGITAKCNLPHRLMQSEYTKPLQPEAPSRFDLIELMQPASLDFYLSLSPEVVPGEP